VGVNLALLLTIVLPRIMRENTAVAQGVGRPADYMLIPGEVSGSDRGVVYIIDSTNRVLSAVAFQDSNSQIEVMAPIDLDRTFQETGNGNAGTSRRRR
jgi:hypothetical protein